MQGEGGGAPGDATQKWGRAAAAAIYPSATEVRLARGFSASVTAP